LKPYVLYQPLYQDKIVNPKQWPWHRELEDFQAMITINGKQVPRFTYEDTDAASTPVIEQ
jgi:hypothetical protein